MWFIVHFKLRNRGRRNGGNGVLSLATVDFMCMKNLCLVAGKKVGHSLAATLHGSILGQIVSTLAHFRR